MFNKNSKNANILRYICSKWSSIPNFKGYTYDEIRNFI